jgi:recombination associated protein RdgC
MNFKSITLFRLHDTHLKDLNEKLATRQFTPTTTSQAVSTGFSPLAINDALSYTADSHTLLNFTVEAKTVPASALRLRLEERCKLFQEENSYFPGRKAKQEMRERLQEELLANALPVRKTIQVVVNLRDHTLIIDSGSPTMVDKIVQELLKAYNFQLEGYRIKQKPSVEMTDRLRYEGSTALSNFDLGSRAETEGQDEGGTVVRYRNVVLTSREVTETLQDNRRRVTKLELSWNDKISFMLDEQLCLKSINFLDTLKSEVKGTKADEDEFRGTFYIVMSHIDDLIKDLTADMGGLHDSADAEDADDAAK